MFTINGNPRVSVQECQEDELYLDAIYFRNRGSLGHWDEIKVNAAEGNNCHLGHISLKQFEAVKEIARQIHQKNGYKF
jgi:hypothetical protein